MAPAGRNALHRIISLAPSVTSILVAIGAGRQLVGITKWCKDVVPAGKLASHVAPSLGDCWSLDVRAVEELRPTLIIGSVPYKTEAVEKLLALPVPFVATNPRSLAGVFADIRLLGRIAGRELAAEELVREMHEAFARVARLAGRARSRPRVYCEAWPKPRISSPAWVTELVDIAGGRMILPAGMRVTDEAVGRAKPDVIIIAWTATGNRPRAAQTLAKPDWQHLPAVRHRRVHVVRDELLNTPGPPLVDGARELFRLLHPELAEAEGQRAEGKR